MAEDLDPSSVTDQLIASLWASALSCSQHTRSLSHTQTHTTQLRYHPVGESWIRPLLTTHPHPNTQTHPSECHLGPLES